ncbi:hypothetical protein CA54_01950 [Symmachiella macrocystis]|uniref:DUF1501 domain-containing protein n=1 Tax=Symmachiella macrocystis TaxID=2527985 RepID=A0A5C6BH71_9PLAN|nr:DUF1501 domain-containing protein [Symmachiella macrocystis]TWU11388.1 hypothetical protein CA54_01950 [Symmachiella macrocystis]
MNLFHHQSVNVSRHGFSRRGFLQTLSAGAVAAGAMNFRDVMSLQAEELRKQGMSMILLWMAGGPSHLETFDPKPEAENGGPTEAIDTAVPGIQIANGWEKTAAMMQDIALIRSMTNKEGNHRRATYQMHTGYVPSGSVKHPALGSNIAREIGNLDAALPSFVTVGGGRNDNTGAGFLGVDYEPFEVNTAGEMPQNLTSTVPHPRYNKRLGLMKRLEGEFSSRGGATNVTDHGTVYGKASKLVLSPDVKVFDLESESNEIRAAYGNSNFGRGCLLARRLVETGVTFVEVRHGGWDTHKDNFERVKKNASDVDPGFATLIHDLKQRGMLDKTLVVWAGEFGRTPKINANTGRDHYPRAFNAAIAGGGIKGGQVIGKTSDDGSTVEETPVTVPDLLQTVCRSLNVESDKENMSPLGRPMKIVDGGTPVEQLFA